MIHPHLLLLKRPLRLLLLLHLSLLKRPLRLLLLLHLSLLKRPLLRQANAIPGYFA
jgi:hypothetical protein